MIKKNNTWSIFPSGWVLCVSILCFSLSCAGQKIPRDIIQYVNHDIMNISQLETNALKSYASVTGNNYTTDERVHDALKNTVVPFYGRFAELLREISPPTEELRRIHSFYVSGAESMCNGFKLKMVGIEKNDENLIRMGNNQIVAGRDETLKWRTELGILLQKSAVKMK